MNTMQNSQGVKAASGRPVQRALTSRTALAALAALSLPAMGQAAPVNGTKTNAAPAAAIASSKAASVNAAPTVLEQKWVAGQRLAYEVSMDGALTVISDKAAPFFFAGLPLEVEVDGEGDIALDTRAVDASGTGTLALVVPRLKLTGAAWGQTAVLAVENGRGSLALKGMGERPVDARALIEPKTGFQVSRVGRFTGAVPLRPQNATSKDAPAGGDAAAMGMAAMLPQAFLSALPQLWPGRAVRVGDKWSIEARLPLPSRAAAGQNPTVPNPTQQGAASPSLQTSSLQTLDLGKIDMTLLGQEEAQGRTLHRVGVRGTLSLSKEQAAVLMGAAGERAQGASLGGGRQSVQGDIWFDAVAGQVARLDLKLQTHLTGGGATPPKNPARDKARTWNASMNFDGALKMRLRGVSMSGAQPSAVAPVAAPAPNAAPAATARAVP